MAYGTISIPGTDTIKLFFLLKKSLGLHLYHRNKMTGMPPIQAWFLDVNFAFGLNLLHYCEKNEQCPTLAIFLQVRVDLGRQPKSSVAYKSLWMLLTVLP